MRKPLYKAGDIVRVREHLVEKRYESVYFVDEMLPLRGTTFVISHNDHDYFTPRYFSKDNTWCWSEPMLEPVDEEQALIARVKAGGAL